MRSAAGVTLILRCLAVICASSAYGGADDPEVRRQAVLQEESCGVTGGCATTAEAPCDDDGLDVASCPAPTDYVCEHELPGLSVCESPPLSAMLPCWMSSIDGTLTLSEISIPGTHDTMAKGSTACHQDGQANLVHTQTWSLRTMLDAGVRALDIRLRHVNDSFTLEHGIIELPYTFDEDVRDVLATFLADNPTEAVVMFYQIHERDSSNTRTPEESLQASLDDLPDLWITGSTVPTLDDARGKVILPNDMPSEEQNEFDLTFDIIGEKKTLIREFFLESGPKAGVFRLNYFSGASLALYPLTVAGGLRYFYRGTNEVVFEFADGFLGVTMFDFIGEDAVAHVVAQQGATAPSWTDPSEATGSGTTGTP